MLQYVMRLLEDEYQEERELLQVELPKVGEIPQVRFDEAKRLAAEKYGCAMRNRNDLEPGEEQRIGLERLLGRDNVRETDLFLRDVKRLEP